MAEIGLKPCPSVIMQHKWHAAKMTTYISSIFISNRKETVSQSHSLKESHSSFKIMSTTWKDSVLIDYDEQDCSSRRAPLTSFLLICSPSWSPVGVLQLLAHALLHQCISAILLRHHCRHWLSTSWLSLLMGLGLSLKLLRDSFRPVFESLLWQSG